MTKILKKNNNIYDIISTDRDNRKEQRSLEREAFICDCGCGEFYIIAPNILECVDCGFELPDMFWVMVVDDLEEWDCTLEDNHK